MPANVRLRQHTNPFSYQGPYQGEDLDALLGGPPSELEIGPGLGELLVARAREAAEARILGIEVRRAYVDICNAALDKAGIENACAIYAEAKIDVPDLIADASLERIYFMFPDPWFKRRHHKRRVLTRDFAELLTRKLQVGGEFHWATDNGQLALDIRLHLAGVEDLVQIGEVPTAAMHCGRGIFHGNRGHPIFGGRYRRL